MKVKSELSRDPLLGFGWAVWTFLVLLVVIPYLAVVVAGSLLHEYLAKRV